MHAGMLLACVSARCCTNVLRSNFIKQFRETNVSCFISVNSFAKGVYCIHVFSTKVTRPVAISKVSRDWQLYSSRASDGGGSRQVGRYTWHTYERCTVQVSHAVHLSHYLNTVQRTRTGLVGWNAGVSGSTIEKGYCTKNASYLKNKWNTKYWI
jgi:hypothetical protein